MHCRVRAAASVFFFVAAQTRKLSRPASLWWAEEVQKRHARNSDGDAAIIKVCSYFLCFRSLRLSWHVADRAGGKIGLATTMIFCCLGHLRGTLLPRSPLVDVHDSSPRWWLPITPTQLAIAAHCLGDVDRVRTCHRASWMKSSASNRTSPPRACIYQGDTRTRNFCEFYTTSIPVKKTSVSSVRHSYPYPELLQDLDDRATIPGVLVQHFYTCPELL